MNATVPGPCERHVEYYVFEAQVVELPEVSRRIAVRGDQTLADL